MLLSDGTGLSRLARVLAGVALAGVLAGCQVRPLYSTAAGTEGKLASVSISEATSRVEQQVRNDLIFFFGGGAGEAQNPVYHLEMDVNVRTVGVLNDAARDTARAGRVTVSADYNLTRADTGETLASGKRSAGRKTYSLTVVTEEESKSSAVWPSSPGSIAPVSPAF